MNGDPPESPAEVLVAQIRRRIERRYRRIRFVQEELAKLDAAARENSCQTGPDAGRGEKFEDFVFSRIDFSRYKKIDAEEFPLFEEEGLADFDEPFYQKMFRMNREKVREIITRSYIRAGPFYLCKNPSPLLWSIMRTLHTSMEFAPLLSGEDITNSTGPSSPEEILEQIRAVAGVLNGVVFRHDDGMETRLFTPQKIKAGEEKPGGNYPETAVLCGTFHPLNKACTITLI